MLNPIQIYRCPKCKGELVALANSFNCDDCLLEFPIHKKVPILVDEGSSVFRFKQIIRGDEHPPPSSIKPVGILKKLIRTTLKTLANKAPTLYSKKRAIEISKVFLSVIEGLEKPSIVVLSIGNGTGGLIFNELKKNKKIKLLETDVYLSPDRMFVSDIQQIPLASQSVDVVLTEGVLEHVINPQKAVSEIYRVLNQDGLVLSTTPFMLGVHMEVADYTRFSKLGLVKLFERFTPIECGVIDGVFVACAYQLSYLFMAIASTIAPNSEKAMFIAKYLGNYFIFWLKFFDGWARRNPTSEDGAASLYYIGKKSVTNFSDVEVNSLFTGRGICPK